jgi:uncharacterized protein (DUF433 family)
MANELSQQDIEILEKIAGQRMKPTRRQKAIALLDLARGMPLPEVSRHAGITKDDLASLLHRYREGGLAGAGLVPQPTEGKARVKRSQHGTIESTPGVCGGSARISGTRIPVWALVEAHRDLGVSEAQLLLDYPELRAVNLVDAWEYARDHRDEIAAEIRRNAEVV